MTLFINVSNFMVIHVISCSFLFLPFLFLFFFIFGIIITNFFFLALWNETMMKTFKAQCDFLPSNGNQEVKHYNLNSVSSSIDMWQPHVHPNPSSPWSLHSSHLYKRQQARDNNPGVSVNEQQCLMSNCKLHAHVIRNTNKRKRDFGKHAETFFVNVWATTCTRVHENWQIITACMFEYIVVFGFNGSLR